MKMSLECPGCFIKQTIRSGRLFGYSRDLLWELVKDCGRFLADISPEVSPPQNAVALYEMISLRIGKEDPFDELKKESTRQALAIYSELKAKIQASSEPLDAAIRYAACGNVIDYGVSSEFDLMKEVSQALKIDFFRYEYEKFTKRLKNADWILYLGDNCGETVFDRLLIEELGRPVIYVVRGGPIINDVTEQDAIDAGLDKVAKIVSSGCKAPGIVFDWCSEEFKMLYNTAPLVISKGQGNFETLSDEKREIFFLFKIKCQVVSQFVGAPLHSMFFGTVDGI